MRSGVCLTYRTMLVAVRRHAHKQERPAEAVCRAGLFFWSAKQCVVRQTQIRSMTIGMPAPWVCDKALLLLFFAFTCSLWQVLLVRNKVACVRPLVF
jgi:hypothetical protein